jgi:hypothetical protein
MLVLLKAIKLKINFIMNQNKIKNQNHNRPSYPYITIDFKHGKSSMCGTIEQTSS